MKEPDVMRWGEGINLESLVFVKNSWENRVGSLGSDCELPWDPVQGINALDSSELFEITDYTRKLLEESSIGELIS